MRTAEVVYVPVPENIREREQDIAVRQTIEMLIRNDFHNSGTVILQDQADGERIVMHCFSKRL